MEKIRTDYEYKESGLTGVTLGNIAVYKCKKCKNIYPIIPNIKELHRLIAQRLINKRALLTGEELVFLRKEMGVKAKDLAQELGVHKVTISRWENEKESISPAADRLIRVLYWRRIFDEKCEIAKPEIEKFEDSARMFLSSLCQPTIPIEEVLKNIRNRQVHYRISIQDKEWSTSAKSKVHFGFPPITYPSSR